jgi:hypothetical protein
MSVTNAGHHVEDVINLLEAATSWSTAQDPVVRPYWDDAQSEKGPGADQPAVIYVWSPTDSTLDRFSIDETEQEASHTVEVQIWSLDETEPVTLQNDVVRILSQYLNDNAIQTPYTELGPTTVSDFREQKNARVTEHYITSVEVETRGLEPTGLA